MSCDLRRHYRGPISISVFVLALTFILLALLALLPATPNNVLADNNALHVSGAIHGSCLRTSTRLHDWAEHPNDRRRCLDRSRQRHRSEVVLRRSGHL